LAGLLPGSNRTIRLQYYHAGSLAGSWVSSGAGGAHRHVHTLRFWPGCIRAITFHPFIRFVLTYAASV
jgi:hypothetical protein